MLDWPYSTLDEPRGLASNARRRRSGLLRCLAVCAALLVASCRQAGVLDPQGPIASAERLLLINATEIMLVVVVPVILATLGFAWWYRSSNARASRSRDLAYQGQYRVCRLVDPGVGRDPARRGHLDRRPSAGSAGADPRGRQAAPGRRRLARLEMAVHLPRSGHRRGQSAGHPGGNPGRAFA